MENSKASISNGRGSCSRSNILKLGMVIFVVIQLGNVINMSNSRKSGWGAFLYSSTDTDTDSAVHQASDMVQQPPRKYERIPLSDLVLTGGIAPTCKEGQTLIESTILPQFVTHANRKIPKVVHMTSKSRCSVPVFIDNIDKWRFEDHSFYFHDDQAVDRLLQKHWPEFPYLQMMQDCMISGAAKADLYRYLILYEYGGIYTDIDNAPGEKFLNGSVITAEDDSWYVIEQLGIMSQYFMASSPRHPFLHLCVSRLLTRLLEVESVGTQYVPFVSGPGTTKSAMILFMRDKGLGKVPAGHYVGLHNRSVTVVGTRQTGNQWVIRESVGGQAKRKGYAEMGMKHFSQSKGLPQAFVKESCHAHLYSMSANDYALHENATRSITTGVTRNNGTEEEQESINARR
jgi:hypothetical protein